MLPASCLISPSRRSGPQAPPIEFSFKSWSAGSLVKSRVSAPWMPHGYLRSFSSDKDGHFDGGNSTHSHGCVALNHCALESQTKEIGMEAIGKPLQPQLWDLGNGAVNQVSKEGGPQMAVKETVVESILEASKTAGNTTCRSRWGSSRGFPTLWCTAPNQAPRLVEKSPLHLPACRKCRSQTRVPSFRDH